MAAIYGMGNTEIVEAAGIKASKLEHEHVEHFSQTGTIVAATYYYGPLRGTNGRVISLEAAITEAIATDPSRTVTLDLKKSTGAGAFASILSATLQFTSSTVLRVLSTAALSSVSLVDGDMLQLTVAVAGGSGAQAQGLAIRLTVREDASP